MPSSGRKLSRRACDGCKIRKIKCSRINDEPCVGCVTTGVFCTFTKKQMTRGPRSLRAKTIRDIAVAQEAILGETQDLDNTSATATCPGCSGEPTPMATRSSSSCSAATDRLATAPSPQSCTGCSQSRPCRSQSNSGCSPPKPQLTPTPSLVLRLCIYRLRLFPVWPIIAVEEIMASLHQNAHDMEAYALANAVGAATIAQLKLSCSADDDHVTAERMESECQRARQMLYSGEQEPPMNLNSLRISFFLHVYHENKSPGGMRSLLCLREAITIGQMLGLHKHETYRHIPVWEQQMRQRILWLLFITERGVAMLHNLPVVLKCNIRFLDLDDADDQSHILPAFKKLVNLFWLFDRSGAFEALQSSENIQVSTSNGNGSSAYNGIDLLQKELREPSRDSGHDSDVQAADLCVTRQWMQAMLWRASMKQRQATYLSEQATSLSHPIQIAREFLETISSLPSSAVEAHGAAMEYKIYEIARAVADSLANRDIVVRTSGVSDRPGEILNQLQMKLASCRGGNKTLLTLLRAHIAEAQGGSIVIPNPMPSTYVEELDENEELLPLQPPQAPPTGFDLGERSLGSYVTQSTNSETPILHDIIQQMSSIPSFEANIRTDWLDASSQGRQLLSGNSPGLDSYHPPHDLYSQLQTFDGSFNNVESSNTIDIIFANGARWDTSDNWEMPTVEETSCSYF